LRGSAAVLRGVLAKNLASLQALVYLSADTSPTKVPRTFSVHLVSSLVISTFQFHVPS
jgi:hypothetical protein